jgi:hypothetical protein
MTIPEADQATDDGRTHGIGVVLTAHRDETFHSETEDEHLVLRLRKARRRFEEGKEPSTRYRFDVLDREMIPEDVETTSHGVSEDRRTGLVPAGPATPESAVGADPT